MTPASQHYAPYASQPLSANWPLPLDSIAFSAGAAFSDICH